MPLRLPLTLLVALVVAVPASADSITLPGNQTGQVGAWSTHTTAEIAAGQQFNIQVTGAATWCLDVQRAQRVDNRCLTTTQPNATLTWKINSTDPTSSAPYRLALATLTTHESEAGPAIATMTIPLLQYDPASFLLPPGNLDLTVTPENMSHAVGSWQVPLGELETYLDFNASNSVTKLPIRAQFCIPTAIGGVEIFKKRPCSYGGFYYKAKHVLQAGIADDGQRINTPLAMGRYTLPLTTADGLPTSQIVHATWDPLFFRFPNGTVRRGRTVKRKFYIQNLGETKESTQLCYEDRGAIALRSPARQSCHSYTLGPHQRRYVTVKVKGIRRGMGHLAITRNDLAGSRALSFYLRVR